MTENVVKYLNMTIKDKLVEIIYLQLCSLIKWDGVYKKGTSWEGPRPYVPHIFELPSNYQVIIW